MGWDPARLLDPEFLILSTHGGLRAENGEAIALGFHTGHWEVGLLVAEAARELKSLRATPFAGACTDPCDGRTQGTTGMMDSLPYRNDAAIVLRRLMRSLPTGKGVIGIATCDKGLPAMMMALASLGSKPAVLVPGGVTLLPESGEDAAKVQTIGARFAQKQITLEYAAEVGCRACASPGGGCQFLGTAATAQVVGEALGLSLAAHRACAFRPAGLARCRAPLGPRHAAPASTRIGRARHCHARGHSQRHGAARGVWRIDQSAHPSSGHCVRGGIAAAHGRRLGRSQSPGAAPGGCAAQRPAQLCHGAGISGRRRAGSDAGTACGRAARHERKTVSGETLGACLDWWRGSERRAALRRRLQELDGIDPDDVIMSPRSRAVPRAHFDRLFPRRQSCAGGIGHQEHGHRSIARRRRIMSTGTPARRGYLSPKPRRFRPSRPARSRRAT